MKMKLETVNKIKQDIQNELELAKNHKEWLKENAKFKDLNIRFMWDCYHGIVKTETKEEVRQQDLNDAHITSGLRKACKELNLI